ncbi:MAG TPA: hypothetical protein VGC18_14440 [Lacisediminihabitans sp.]|uniref:hypothetical protein n=1 Tax=Lacisediminihabitans sp. TaxID=2787631 RepID=UPI002ED9A8CC
MTTELAAAQPPHAGRTTIRPQAIRRLVEAVAADAAGVPAGRVNAALSDEHGRLIVRVTSPVELTARTTSPRTLLDRAGELATVVAAGLDDLAGRSVRRVDVRITGVNRSNERRVL